LGRAWQKLVLFAPVPFFILKLCGGADVNSWLDAPTIKGALKLIVAFITSLFGSEALTGLTVLLIIEAFLIWRLASRRIKGIEKEARSIAKAGIDILTKAIDSAGREIIDERMKAINRIQTGINRVIALGSAFSK
jgi:hypothetical protein